MKYTQILARIGIILALNVYNGAILTNNGAQTAYAQLSAPMTGRMEQQPLLYYRVGFVSLHKQLKHSEVLELISSLEKEPIAEKYLFLPKQSSDKTYEVEMLLKIIFLDKHEAENAVEFLKQNPMFCTKSFSIEVIQCQQ